MFAGNGSFSAEIVDFDDHVHVGFHSESFHFMGKIIIMESVSFYQLRLKLV